MHNLLIVKVERTRITLDHKNIKRYKKTCREFNRKYNNVLSELLTSKYSLPTREEWDNLVYEINKLRKEIYNLKLKQKTEEEMFQSSLRAFKESQGEHVDTNDELELKNREEKLQIMINYKNNLHKLANNSNISTSTINKLLISSNFDSALRSYFQRTIVTTVDRFKAKPNNKECIEFNKPLAGLPRYRKINQPITLEFTNQSYRFLRNNKNKIIGIKLGKIFKNISLKDKFTNEFLNNNNNNTKINNIALTSVSENSIVDGKFYLLINYEYNSLTPLPNFKNKVGIDMGLSDLVVTSDGEKFNYPGNSIDKLENRRTKLQSYLSTKRRKNKHWKKSNRYKKLKYKIDKLYIKEKNIRENFAHEVSRYLINKYDIITVEDLDIRGMMKNKNLSRKIANASWNRIANFLKYKCRNENKVFRQSYKRYPSTRICHRCKTKSDKFEGPQSLSIREWKCDKCGTFHNRDINAALNIRDWEPRSDNAISRTEKMVYKVRGSQIRDFINWITFALYLDILRKDKTRQFLNKLLQVTNLKTISAEEDKYMQDLLEKDKKRKNKRYQLALNKLDELNRIKRIDNLENEINFNKFKNICLRLETLNIK